MNPQPLCGPDGSLIGTWNGALVALSYIVAVAGSFVALDWADRMRTVKDRRTRRRYFIIGATLMGLSVWTMHFVGMLALNLGIAVRYDPLLGFASVVAAAVGAGLAFLIVNRPHVTRFNVALGGLAMGLAIASMHYLGMASMRMAAIIQYDPLLFIASVAIAIAASAGALTLARRPLKAAGNRHWIKTFSALAMGFAIAGMHYVGMAAARYLPTPVGLEANETAWVGGVSLQHVLLAAGLLIGGALIAMASRHAAERQAALESLEEKSAQLAAASRAKDMFLASLSHELRTPLNPALLLATESAGNPLYPPEARHAFQTIAQNISLEARLIDDLLDLTRISRGILKLEPRPTDVHEVLASAIEFVQPTLIERRIRLVLGCDARATHALADPDRLKQVFWNLLQNAAKFSEPGSAITLTTRNAGDAIEVRIQDTGLGMDEAERAKCFDSFAQGEHHRGGLGMGLAISRSIVELLGGSIAAASPGRGHGSTFVVRLQNVPAPMPRSGHSAPTQAPPLPEPPPLSVLLVEDHEPSRVTLERLLQRRSHTVTSVGTREAAVAAGSRQPFDLVISDIGLPDGTGYDVIAALRMQRPVVGIAITGFGMEEDVRRAAEAGFAVHLIKPVTVAKLERALAEAARHLDGKPAVSGQVQG